MHSAPILWCVLAAALFGASTPVAKTLLDGFNVFFLSGLLYLGAAIAVAPWSFRNLRLLLALNNTNRWRLAGAVIFGGIGGPLAMLLGLQLANAGSVVLWLNLETVATTLLALLIFGEHVTGKTWTAMLLILAASLCLTPLEPHGWVAVSFIALAGFCWGLDNNWTALIDGISPAQTTFVKGLAAGIFNLSLGFVVEPAVSADLSAIAMALVIGGASYGLSILLYIAGAQQLGASRSQMLFSTAPIWGLAIAWLWQQEPLGLLHGIAAAMMLLAAWLIAKDAHGHPHQHAAQTHFHWHRHDDRHHQHDHGTRPGWLWHSHEHSHTVEEHDHPHWPDLHHRHGHDRVPSTDARSKAPSP